MSTESGRGEVPTACRAAPHDFPDTPYMLEGEMLFELEGEQPRVVRAGEAFSEPGGDLVHWQAANRLADATSRFVVVMVCTPGVPMLTFLTPEERAERQHLRHPSAADSTP